jgi:orotidine-5'-phosphate decarboxylase
MMRRAVEEVREVCGRENLIVPKIIAVTVLTSSNQETLNETGIPRDIDEQVVKLAKLTSEYN